MSVFDEVWNEFFDREFRTMALWERLTQEGKFELIELLRHVEQGEDGFGTVVVHKEGFSENDETHNMVLDWLEERKINILNPGLEKTRLEGALYGSRFGRNEEDD